MTISTAARGARGGAVTAIGQIAKMFIQITSVVVLSRILEPDDFGLIAMTAVFVSLGSLIRDFGMATAALQARSLSQHQASNMYWVSCSLGLFAALLITVFSPAISSLYSEPRLTQLLPVVASSLILGGIAAQHQVQLARSFKFARLAGADVVSQAAGLAVAIVTAMLGAGYWALAWQAVSTALVLLLAQSLMSGWIPSTPRRHVGSRRLVESGAHFGTAQLFTFAASNADTIAIGARWGSEDLGFYNRAFQLLSMPVQATMAPLTNVVIPVINRYRDEGRSVDSVLLRVQFLIGLPTIWIFLVAGVSAQYFIPLALGPGWDISASLFQVLAFGGAIQAFSFVSYWAFIAHNQSKQLLHYNLVTKSITAIAVVSSSLISVEAVAWAYSISLTVSWPVNLIWLARTAGQNSWAYFRSGIRILAAAAVAALVTAAFMKITDWQLSPFAGTLALGALSTIVYLVAILVTPGGLSQLRRSTSLVRRIVHRSYD